ncbi:Crp/Fnr family transcriptional regulator [Aquimarina sp. AD10]|uniref:Crp/Fnr family transcriptional regulator n=2 Tax=Flavobacteriaceae TaxID=49546 RepID=A0A163CJN1_9FLAO|nr:Crp/Fnr family transcriptional regulator [Aquimarina sp. AD10]KZS42486.1 Crp/Fnr family transcriptional regulator [Aquimarina aggregata]RKN00418.1 Crp/Fnr family transcriptional regulator [Aquimarina sp. AD10]
MISEALNTYFPKLAKMPKLKEELIAISSIHKFDAGTVILKQGSYIKVIPLVVSGLAKVFKEEPVNGNEVLLYYIKPGESCVMSVTTLVRNETSRVKAVIEEDSEVVIIPADKALEIAKKYPKWNEFIYDLFNFKFEELINVIEILTFSNKDKRLLEYLKKEARLKGSFMLHTTHQHIAYDLGSSREVISRLLKKLEQDGLITLRQGVIELLHTT